MTAVTQNYLRVVRSQGFKQNLNFLMGYGVLIMVFFVTVELMRIFQPQYGAAILILIAVVGVAILNPAAGLGVAITLTVVGDAVAMPWWPMSKNLSATESVLFTADAATISPLEITLVTVVGVWLINRRLRRDTSPIQFGLVGRPLGIFSISLATGLVWGIGRGGDFRIAIFEILSLIYIPIVYVAATNLFTTLAHYRRLLLGIVVALTVQTFHGLFRLPSIRQVIAEDGSPVEHTAVLHMNLLFLLFVALLWFGTKRPEKRTILFIILIPTLILYLDAQRRAGVVALIIGGITLTIVLFTRNRQKFYRIIPVMLVVIALYSGAFWNSTNQFAFPAQAVKTVIQPDASSDKDSRSDLYRDIENFNLHSTIRSNPVLGIGFGQRFFQPIPLPDISFFEFADYIAHNSVLWLWTKLGVVGFVSFLYMTALGTASGIRAAVRFRDPDDASMVMVMTAFLPMTLVLAYVEITFDPTTTVLFAVCLALTGSAERLRVKEAGPDDAAPFSPAEHNLVDSDTDQHDHDKLLQDAAAAGQPSLGPNVGTT